MNHYFFWLLFLSLKLEKSGLQNGLLFVEFRIKLSLLGD